MPCTAARLEQRPGTFAGKRAPRRTAHVALACGEADAKFRASDNAIENSVADRRWRTGHYIRLTASAGIGALLSRAKSKNLRCRGLSLRQDKSKEEVCDLKPIIVTQRGSTPSQQRRSPPAGSESCMGDILLSVDSGYQSPVADVETMVVQTKAFLPCRGPGAAPGKPL